jgi:hypothetical protein
VDVFNWLVCTYELDVYAVDGYGRSVMSLSKSAGSTRCEDAIKRTESTQRIKKAVHKYIKKLRHLTLTKLRDQASLILQTRVRQHQAFSRYGPSLLSSRTVRARSRMVWGAVIKALKGKGDDKHLMLFSWAQAKTQYDMIAGDITGLDNDERGDGKEEAVLRQLIDATAVLFVHREGGIRDEEVEKDIVTDNDVRSSNVTTPVTHMSHAVRPMDTVEFTQSVVKWLEKADKKYRHMFCRVIEQLANGDRSYALSKRLTNCHQPMFEAKLDAGQRILWTKLLRKEGEREGNAVKLESIMVRFFNRLQMLHLLLLPYSIVSISLHKTLSLSLPLLKLSFAD